MGAKRFRQTTVDWWTSVREQFKWEIPTVLIAGIVGWFWPFLTVRGDVVSAVVHVIIAFAAILVVVWVFHFLRAPLKITLKEQGIRIAGLEDELEKWQGKCESHHDPWDFPIWDAIQYILKETAYGSNKWWSYISSDLLRAARAGRIRVWGRRTLSNSYEKITVRELQRAYFEVQPSDPGGKIRIFARDDESSSNEYYWYDGRFSRVEIEREFASRQATSVS